MTTTIPAPLAGRNGAVRCLGGALAMGALAVCLGACSAPPPEPRQTLTVVTRNSPTTFFEDRQGELAGLEYELVSEFARQQDLEVEFVVRHGIGEILDAIESGQADLAAAGLTKTPERAARFLIGPEYQGIEEQVVCHPRARVREVADLVGRSIRVIADSSYQETLATLREAEPGLEWSTAGEESTEQLLQEVAEGRLDCTVADSNIVALSRSLLPELKSPFSLGETSYLAWFVSEQAGDLMEPLETWFDGMRASGRLQTLLSRYYWRDQEFDHYDASVFFRRVENLLPYYEGIFIDAEELTGVDWRLLAAVAYQESHWDPEAVSLTGVRGLMMLTEETAIELGVDRLDPYESVVGGAHYLADLIERVPSFVPEPDRTLLGLAAYNIGYSHLEDARKLAIEIGRDPNSWEGLRETLPLLSRPRYYQTLRHGYARGNEPVIFVEQVRNYYDLLAEAFSRAHGEELPAGVLVSSLRTGR
jgi:membrane-bound lytic murein transglycosylase F